MVDAEESRTYIVYIYMYIGILPRLRGGKEYVKVKVNKRDGKYENKKKSVQMLLVNS